MITWVIDISHHSSREHRWPSPKYIHRERLRACWWCSYIVICEILRACWWCSYIVICERLRACWWCSYIVICERLRACWWCSYIVICERLRACWWCSYIVICEKAYWFRCCLARISGALGPLIIYPIHDSCHDRRKLRRIYPPAWCMRGPVEGHHTGNILFQCVNEGSSWVQLVSMHKWPKACVKTITSTTCMYPCHPESNGNGKKH